MQRVLLDSSYLNHKKAVTNGGKKMQEDFTFLYLHLESQELHIIQNFIKHSCPISLHKTCGFEYEQEPFLTIRIYN